MARPATRSDLHYQAVIDKQSRNCVVSNGKITVKMGVVGRVLLGPPATRPRRSAAPLRRRARRHGGVLREVQDARSSSPAARSTGDFVKVVENVEIPYLGGESITIWVGFDPRG
jgi:hypothetical protein